MCIRNIGDEKEKIENNAVHISSAIIGIGPDYLASTAFFMVTDISCGGQWRF